MNRAAGTLLMTQSNLSRVVISLEAELSIKFFKRNNKGIVMTGDGKKLYQHNGTILNQMDLIKGVALREVAPVLSIVSYPLMSILRLLCEVYNNHEDGSLKIQLSERRLQCVAETAESGEAELGFLMYNDVQSKEIRYMLYYKYIESNYLGTNTWYVNVGPRSPPYNREEMEASELLSYPAVRIPNDYFPNLTFYLSINGILLTGFKKVEYMNDSVTMISLLKYADIFRLEPGINGKDFVMHRIKTIPIKNCEVNIGAVWIRRKKEMLSAAARESVQMLELWIPKAIHQSC